ncbi:MAG: YggS family pyridoxal phosphate-dependent enzyme [Kiritimatiellae bacterium]|nr:YggS family pyridoxal phosphate-dependent enzyme [Kiritimatiellia bacterium]
MIKNNFASFAERLNMVRTRIAAASEKDGRAPDAVRLLAASKAQPPESIRQAAECGLVMFGENRIQEASQKIPLCPGQLEWHLIGHLQSNKVRVAVSLFRMIHSVDSQKLLAAVEDAAEAAGRQIPVCLEVNVSGEGAKFGFAPEMVPETLLFAERLKRVEIKGLMTIPPAVKDPELVRPFFKKLRTLRDQWRDQTGFALDELSMGMSHDFEIAVEEGATIVRLGTILFGQRKNNQTAGKIEGAE